MMNACYDPKVIEFLLRYASDSPEAAALRAHTAGCARCRADFETIVSRLLIEQIRAGGGHPEYEVLDAYLDDPGDERMQAPLKAHLDACAECAGRLDALRAERLSAAPRGLKQRLLAFWIAPHRRRQVYVLGGSALTLAILLILLLPRTRVSPTSPALHGPLPSSHHAGSDGGTAPDVQDGVLNVTRSADGRFSVLVRDKGRLETSLARLAVAGLSDLSHSLQIAMRPEFPGPDAVAPRGNVTGRAVMRGEAMRLIEPVEGVVLAPPIVVRWHPLPGKGVRYTVYGAEVGKPLRVRLGETRDTRFGVRTWQPGHSYHWKVYAADAQGKPLPGSKEANLRIMPAAKAAAIAAYPNAHLLRGFLFETEGAFQLALAEYDKLPVDSRSASFIHQLKRRVHTEMELNHARTTPRPHH